MKKILFGYIISAFLFLVPGILSAQEKPFVMAVEDVFNISGYGNMVKGKVESGIVKKGMKLEVKGKGDSTYLVTVAAIFKGISTQVNEATINQAITINIRGVNTGDIKPGMVMSAPGSMAVFSSVEVWATLLPAGTSGWSKALKNDMRIQLQVRSDLASGTVSLNDNQPEIKPGESGMMLIKLQEPTPLLKGDSISLKNFNKLIGTAVVKELIH